MKKRLTPQAQRVLEIMLNDGEVTRLSAMHYGVANITARISELRSAGHKVACDESLDASRRRFGTWRLYLDPVPQQGELFGITA